MKYVDLIGPKPQLRIGDSYRFRTNLGGVLTCILAIISVLLFIGFGIDIFERKKPSSYVTKKSNENPNIKSDDLFFMISMYGPLSAPIYDINKKFQIVINYYDLDTSRNPQINRTIVNMVPCNTTAVYKENKYNMRSQIKNIIESYYCVPDDFRKDISGVANSQKFSKYQFIV
jgi:hypothetical protein